VDRPKFYGDRDILHDDAHRNSLLSSSVSRSHDLKTHGAQLASMRGAECDRADHRMTRLARARGLDLNANCGRPRPVVLQLARGSLFGQTSTSVVRARFYGATPCELRRHQ